MLTVSDKPGHRTRAALRRFGEIDWDFPAQSSESPFSSVHWHPCRFPSQIPALAIGRMCPLEGLVLDPFMGSGTTLVEAQRLGRPCVGIDVNPVSCLVAKAKTLSEDTSEIRRAINGLKLTISSVWGKTAPAPLPRSVQGTKWYMPSTLTALRKIWGITSEVNGIKSAIARGCFSAILLQACREERNWGYVCDNTQPKSEREPDAKALFLAALERFMIAYEERSNEVGRRSQQARIINNDAAAALSELPSDCIDCVVTSPPYFGVTDYVKAQRLTMEWLSSEIEPIRQREIGARSKRHRLSALDDYLRELDMVFSQVYRTLKASGTAIVVFGQSPSRPDAQTSFVENLRKLGFDIWMERRRNISVGRRQIPSLVNETVLVVRK